MTKRSLLILAMIFGACTGPEDASTTSRHALELPPVGECSTLTGDVRLDGQADVETFGARTCEAVDGSMLVTGASDLSPLAGLTSVSGALHIRETSATSLAGLEALQSADELVIEDNAQLVTAVLPALTSVGHLRIVNNVALTTLTVDALPTTDALSLRALPELATLSFAALQLVVGELHLVSTKLINAAGLSALSSVGSLVVSNNDVLLNLDDLDSLGSVTDELVIRQNDRLGSLAGLSSLVAVGGRVAITSNLLLQDVELAALTTSEELLVHRNPVLQTTNTLNPAYVADLVHIEGNAILSSVAGLPLGPNTDLYIEDSPGLVSLDSLGAESVDSIYIRSNPGLGATTVPIVSADYVSITWNSATSMSFPALTGFSGINVQNNDAMTSLTFGQLSGADVYIFENFDLATVSFPMLTTADDFDLEDNPDVTTLSLPSLTTVTDDFRIIDAGLTDLSGLGSLQSVADDFEILANEDLLNVTGMAQLATVGDTFNVTDNPSLVSLSGFSSLAEVEHFVVEDNPSLPDCQATDLAAVVTINGSTTIANNGGTAGCP